MSEWALSVKALDVEPVDGQVFVGTARADDWWEIKPVKPVAIVTVSYDDGPFYIDGVGDLPYGRYAIVRLDDE